MTKTDLRGEFEAHRDAAMAENEARLGERFDAAVARAGDEVRGAWPEAADLVDDLEWREVGIGHSPGGALCEVVYRVGTDAVGWRYFSLAWSADARDWRWGEVTYSMERGFGAPASDS